MDGKQLKNSILQWAIQGKLVSQNPKDEPAQKLLERIDASRNESSLSLPKGTSSTSLRGAKATKQSKALSSCIYRENGVWYEQIGTATPKDISDEIPFEIPENWVWARWGELSDSIQYGYNAPALQSGRIKMVRISDIHDNKIEWDKVPYCQIKESEISTYLLQKNDILFARTGGTVGKSYLVSDVTTEAVYAGYLIRTRYNFDLLSPQYLKFFMESSLYWEQLREGTIATAQPNCNGKTLGKMLLPLPPLAEQKRIVAKLEQVLPLAEEYGAAQEQLDKLNKELPEALKKSILQEAIQGKLVLQNPKDEPAQKLLERIAASRNESSLSLPKGTSSTSLRGAKATKQSKNPPSRIYRENGVWYEQIGTATPKDITDEIPFEIPETWAWCRFNSICDIARGGSPRPIQNYLTDSPEGYNWIKIGDTEKGGKYINSTKERIKPEGLTKTRLIHKGDFLLTNSMSFGRPYISNIDGCIHDGWLVMSILGNAFVPDYLYYLLSSPYAYHQFCGRVAGAVVKNLNIDKVAESLIPLPPLAEQKRIVSKLEQLFKVL
ncbi:MAG: restriction endonuclease subunit S [Fibrobacter sp.]|nr:restriction endonuclease subunit S [Fibrobacter sp.]